MCHVLLLASVTVRIIVKSLLQYKSWYPDFLGLDFLSLDWKKTAAWSMMTHSHEAFEDPTCATHGNAGFCVWPWKEDYAAEHIRCVRNAKCDLCPGLQSLLSAVSSFCAELLGLSAASTLSQNFALPFWKMCFFCIEDLMMIFLIKYDIDDIWLACDGKRGRMQSWR